MADDITIFIDNIAIFIDVPTDQFLAVAVNDRPDGIPVVVFNKTVLDDNDAFESGERTLRFRLALARGNQLATANHLAAVVPNLSVFVDFTAGEFFRIALDETPDGHTVGT